MHVAQASKAAGAGALALLTLLIVNFGAIAVHVGTIIILFDRVGFGGAIFGFMMPVLAEIYLFAKLWIEVGFLNLYTVIVGGWILACLVVAGGWAIAYKLTPT